MGTIENEYDKIIDRFERKFIRYNYWAVVILIIFATWCFFPASHFCEVFNITTEQYLTHIFLRLLIPIIAASTIYGFLFIKTNVNSFIHDITPLIFNETIALIIMTVYYMFPVVYLLVLVAPLMSIIYGNRRFLRILTIISIVVIVLSSIRSVYISENFIPLPIYYLAALIYTVVMFLFVAWIARTSIIYEKEKETKFIIEREKKRQLKQDNKLLKEDVYTDDLTEIPNYKALSEKTQSLINDVDVIYYCMLDIDNFKQVNDTYGHEFGNVVLKVLGSELNSIVREEINEEIYVARYGGEEFGILFRNVDERRILSVVENLRKTFSKREYRETDQRFTFSAGISKLEKGMSATALFSSADKKLYEAKHNGKNQVIM